MAGVFLSYAREDAAKAKSLARALERAGHGVWWDRHIRGGSQFAGAIEQALRNADAVLVLWSKTSVDSPWVRDEASEGRDSDRLVPVVLDGSRPPIGFRQYQSIDVSGWNGKGEPKQFGELLSAISDKAEAPADPDGAREQIPDAAATKSGKPFRITAAIIALAALAVLVIGGWLYTSRDSAAAETPTIAVLPFADLSPGGDKAYFAEGVAEAILSMLAREPGLNVIGRTSSWQFKDRSADLGAIREALGVTHVLEGSARTSGDQLRMSVRLLDASTGRQIWAEDYQRRMSNIFAVQDEIGRAVAERLKGTLAVAVRSERQVTKVDTYALYLAARAEMRERKAPNLRKALELAKQVIAADPNYAPGHAIFAEILWLLSDRIYGNIPRGQIEALARPHAMRAIRLAPRSAEGYAALGAIYVWDKPQAAVEPLRRAISLDPSRGELRLWLALAYGELGRNEEALQQYRAVTEMEPLWGTPLLSYIPALTGAGRFDEAAALLDKFESRGGSRALATRMRSEIAGMRGDYSEAARFARLAVEIDPDTIRGASALAEAYFYLGLKRQAEQMSRNWHPYVQLLISGDQARLAEAVRDAGSAIWTQPHPDLAIGALASQRDWATIANLYEKRPESAEDLCASSNLDLALNVGMALREAGRSDEAATILGCIKESLAKGARGPIRPVNLPDKRIAVLNAQISALERQPRAAFDALGRAIDLGFRTPYATGLSDFPAFDAFRSTSEYELLDARLKQLIAGERQQVLRQLRGS